MKLYFIRKKRTADQSVFLLLDVVGAKMAAGGRPRTDFEFPESFPHFLELIRRSSGMILAVEVYDEMN